MSNGTVVVVTGSAALIAAGVVSVYYQRALRRARREGRRDVLRWQSGQ